MGVHGLWRLLEPAGKPVSLDTLRGRTLAIDISIWLHRMVKGFRDAKGGSVPNAHLLGLFQRLCKLLFYGIKPIFVFDGSFPALKRQTIINRQTKKSQLKSDVEKMRRQLMDVIVKHAAVQSALIGAKPLSPRKSPIKTVGPEDDLFKLPPKLVSDSSEESEEDVLSEPVEKRSRYELHTIDVNSADFKKLTPRERHDILTDLKETRKESSWGRIHELPKKLDNFSDYQMGRLLKRRQVQESLEETEKEIGGHYLTLNDLEVLLNEEGIDTKIETIPTRKIASNENAGYILVKNVKEAYDRANKFEESKKAEEEGNLSPQEMTTPNLVDNVATNKIAVSNIDDKLGEEYDEELQLAIKISLQDSDEGISLGKNVEFQEEKITLAKPIVKNKIDFSSARAFMTEFSGLTDYEIDKIINNEISNPACSVKNLNKKSCLDIKSNEEPETSIIMIDEDDVTITKLTETNEAIEILGDENELEEIKIVTCDSKVVIPKEKILEVSNESIDSDSDGSFEEVPEKEIDNDRSSREDHDIFADVFKDSTQLKLLDEVMVSQINKLQQSEQPIKSNNLEDKLNSNIDKQESLQLKFDKETNISIEDKIEIPSPEKIFPPKVDSQSEEIVNISTKETSNDSSFQTNLPSTSKSITDEDIVLLQEDLENQRNSLELEQNKLDRMGRNVTEEMSKDAQELLKLFGIPYIIAPMEAEAQCAFLESINLTDGTITDDSDIWLFGGKTVYKDFFNQQKHVLQFLSKNIEGSFKLQREDLILLALLVGSDYTIGVTGVGPVTALEILSAFPPNKTEIKPPYTRLLEGLQKFKNWISKNYAYTNTTLRNKLKNIMLTEEFPNYKVVEAYLVPEVESSKESFTWGKPDIPSLRCYTKEKFGWSQAKFEETLIPVLKKMENKTSQTTIGSYFATEFKVDAATEKMSKRVKKAVENFGSDEPSTSTELADPLNPTLKKSRAPKKSKTSDLATEETPAVNFEKDKKIVRKKKTKNEENAEKVPKNKIFSADIIPQRELDKSNILKNKLKAIEEFRKSKKGPGFVKKSKRQIRIPKEDAGLSESDSS